ncbi:2OG-Fe(II) oxygenase [Lysobacter sp. K5869]|uniref:2OG-Fe(II) oxygenase n=1 Tax=Lysobacter sp. K5869 TaxID=2820808 RepID=UPI001C0609A5|nr:2OG-Fe(II) oxygenase [Lysobacter sp. K5869]QWP77329.1 2OG-Fe(II) oxygenase [Lysobacter sp. K5869]
MKADAENADGATPDRTDARERLRRRIAGYDWDALGAALDAQGWAVLPNLLSARQCAALADAYGEDERYRSRVVMQRHGFGRGEYRYYRYPLPPMVQALREGLYPRLAPVAARWGAALGESGEYPDSLDAFLARCHAAGQPRPTPLLLRYAEGDYNCLHQDVYGEHVFPLQTAILLSQPGRDFEGGEFVLTEQRPRMQSRAQVVPLRQGDAVAFAVRHRPHRGARGFYRVHLRHGVSALRAGTRHTLGVIFHDAQ